MSAALSRDKDAYMWGKERPREGTQKIAALPGNDEDLQLVDLGDGVDVIDIGVGSGHAVVVASNGRVFAAGENDNGQLGLEADSAEFESDWREVKGLRGKKVKSIWCGDNTSLVLVEP